MMKDSDHLAFPIVERFGFESDRGARLTAPEENGIAPLASQGHRQFPKLRAPHRLDGEFNPLTMRRQLTDSTLFRADSFKVDHGVGAERPGQFQLAGPAA